MNLQMLLLLESFLLLAQSDSTTKTLMYEKYLSSDNHSKWQSEDQYVINLYHLFHQEDKNKHYIMSWPCDDLGTDARKWFPQTMRKKASTSSSQEWAPQMLNTKDREKELRTFVVQTLLERWIGGGCVRTVCWADTKTIAGVSKRDPGRAVTVIVVDCMRGILGGQVTVKVVKVRWS